MTAWLKSVSANGSTDVASGKQLPGELLQSKASRHGHKIFYCKDGYRHWITDPAWIAENGFAWPADLREVSEDQIEALRVAQPAPRTWSEADRRVPPLHSTISMREIAVSQLKGTGIEVGAGTNPMPLPLHSQVRYVDLYDIEDLKREAYDGQASNDFVVPEIKAQFENLSIIPDSSLDFVVACHVIEHTRDPIGTIAGAWRKLRPGGSIVLVVPEMTRTFDRDRALTPLAHLVEDYRDPDLTRLRDQAHFQEFYEKAFVTPPEDYEVTWRGKWEEAYPIHYHTWTYASFEEMVRWMRNNNAISDVGEIWSHEPLSNTTDCIEFWYALRRG
jgi:SAM-dependent methyltransferase